MSMSDVPRVNRGKSWGQDYEFSLMDRFGMWLSTRQIRRRLGGLTEKDVCDIGCGFNAVFIRSILDEVRSATVVDLSLAPDLKENPKVHAIEGILPDVLDRIAEHSLDIVICNNILEHLWDPKKALERVRRMLRHGGACFLNVPSWRGKFVLETAAFRLGITSREEINDHKTYYAPRELWSLVVKSGFKPSEIICRTHKFGLNTYAVCTVD